MNIDRSTISDAIRTNKITQPLYKKFKTLKDADNFRIDSIPIPEPIRVDYDNLRFNLVLPTMRKTRVFAGITTAIKFFEKLIADYDCKARIIIMNPEKYNEKYIYKINGFSCENESKRTLHYLNDNRQIEIGKNDIFVFTYWKSAYAFLPIIRWQRNEYFLRNRIGLYLIQDYEPGFDAWSTKYALAESTYSSDPSLVFAIYNSKELYDYFKRDGYHFAREIFFAPVLNNKLAEILLDKKADNAKRKKQIIIYGRPSDERNAFEIIRYALKLWSEQYPSANEWKIISLGEWFDNIILSNNVIESHGKVSLEEYADYMLNSYIGISLMISPHPSYPPLEMSTFGVKTITNVFENKDLSTFNKNIISLRKYTPEIIAGKLSELCDSYSEENSEIILNENYIHDESFGRMVEMVEERLNELLSES